MSDGTHVMTDNAERGIDYDRLRDRLLDLTERYPTCLIVVGGLDRGTYDFIHGEDLHALLVQHDNQAGTDHRDDQASATVDVANKRRAELLCALDQDKAAGFTGWYIGNSEVGQPVHLTPRELRLLLARAARRDEGADAAVDENGLKPCPFCGGKADAENLDDAPGAWIYCTECGARGAFDHTGNETSAGERWNARSRPEAARPAGGGAGWGCVRLEGRRVGRP